MNRHFILFAAATLLLFGGAHASALAGNKTVKVAGAGTAELTDPDEETYPLAFALAGAIKADGSAQGTIKFYFSSAFSEVWGAVPGVDAITLSGTITSGEIGDDGSVTLKGTLTEIDFSFEDGIVFEEANVPFEIVIGGPKRFLLQWCELPTFDVRVTRGAVKAQ